MRLWVVALILFCTSANAQLVVRRAGTTGVVGSFFLIRSEDCSTIYFVPRQYRIQNDESSIVSYSNTPNGTPTPVVNMTISLAPDPASPSVEEKREIQEWSAKVDQSCPSGVAALVAYPWMHQSLDVKMAGSEVEFPKISAESRPDGKKTLRIEAVVGRVPLAELIERLGFLRPRQNIRLFQVETDIAVTLSASYEAAAQFAMHNYTERTCEEARICEKKLFVSTECHTETLCKDIPKVVQVFNQLRGQSQIKMSIIARPGASETKILDLQGQLFSRLMTSLYVENSRRHFGEVMEVVLGDLKREVSGNYFDRLTSIRVVDRTIVDPIEDFDFAKFATPVLTKIYKSMERK